MLFSNPHKAIKPNLHATATEWAQKLYQTKVLHLQVKKSLFLLVGATMIFCTLLLPLRILNLSSLEAALVIAPFSFNKDSASPKIAEIVVFGILLIFFN